MNSNNFISQINNFKQVQINKFKFLRRKNLLTLWAKHLILEGYSIGLNLNTTQKSRSEKLRK